MTKWRISTLGDECDLYQPKTISMKEMKPSGEFPVYGANGQIGFYDKFNHEDSQVLLSCRGNCGTVNVSRPKAWINGNAMVCAPKTPDLSKDFLAYYLQSVDWKPVITGTAQPQITRQPLAKVQLPVPPLEEQRRIVETLDDHLSRLDKALAEVCSALQKFETLERSSMALRFAPSSQNEAVKVVRIADVTEKAKSLDPKTLGSESFKYVDIGSISPDSETPNVSEWTPTSDAPSRARQHIKSGDVVFSTVRPYQKKIAIVKEDLHGHIASTGFCVLRPIHGVLDTRYLFHYLKSDALLDQVLPLQRGASYPAVGDSDVKNSTIPLPDFHTQVAIAEELDSIVGNVKSLKSQLKVIANTAETMRRTLLHSAFSGKLLEEK